MSPLLDRLEDLVLCFEIVLLVAPSSLSAELRTALYVAGSSKPGNSSGYLNSLLPLINRISWPRGASLIRSSMADRTEVGRMKIIGIWRKGIKASGVKKS